MAKNSHNTVKVPAIRREGSPVTAEVTTRVGVSGVSEVALSFDLNQAPVPTRRYLAHVGSVESVGIGFRLIFAQRKIGGGFRSLLGVQMSRSATENFLNAFGQMSPSLEDTAKQARVEREETTDVNQEPDQAVEFVANFFSGAMAAEEACIDFYHASPFAMRNVMAAKQLDLEPVVRVDLTLGLLMGIVGKLTHLMTRSS